MEINLKNIIKTFEQFAEINKVNISPIDRLQNQLVEFKFKTTAALQSVPPPAPPAPQEFVPNEAMFATNTSGVFGAFAPNTQFKTSIHTPRLAPQTPAQPIQFVNLKQ